MKNTLDSADGVGFTVSSVIGAVNATPEEMIKEFDGDIVEAEALLDMLSGNEESGTTTAEGATDCEVAGSESEVANDIPAEEVMEEGGEPEIIRIIDTHAGVSDDRETIFSGEGDDLEVFDYTASHLMEIIDVEEDDTKRKEKCVELERIEAEASSILPALKDMLPENNGGEEVDDLKIEKVFTKMMKRASNGAELDFESSNCVRRTRTLVPGLGGRLAFLLANSVSGITDTEMTKLIIQWKLDNIVMKKRGQTENPEIA